MQQIILKPSFSGKGKFKLSPLLIAGGWLYRRSLETSCQVVSPFLMKWMTNNVIFFIKQNIIITAINLLIRTQTLQNFQLNIFTIKIHFSIHFSKHATLLCILCKKLIYGQQDKHDLSLLLNVVCSTTKITLVFCFVFKKGVIY